MNAPDQSAGNITIRSTVTEDSAPAAPDPAPLPLCVLLDRLILALILAITLVIAYPLCVVALSRLRPANPRPPAAYNFTASRSSLSRSFLLFRAPPLNKC